MGSGIKKNIESFICDCDHTAKLRGNFSSVDFIVCNSEQAKYGSLFVCLRGQNTDGHNYVVKAYENGCRHFLCEKTISLPDDAAIACVKSVREILCDLLFYFYKLRKDEFVFIAVTGTKGKTTTACLLTHLLNQAGYAAACSTTLGLFDGAETQETQNTTPDLFVLVPWLVQLREKNIRYVIIEASSAALSGARLYGLCFSIGILTSFSKDHVGNGEHKNMAEYLCAKRSLFSSYGVKSAILPKGIYRGEYIVSDAEQRILLPRDRETVGGISEMENGQSFLYNQSRVFLSLVGAHNRTNARLALACASLLTNKNEKSFFAYLSNVYISGRYEQIKHKEVCVVIDYAHNYESFIAVSKAASNRVSGRLICVFGSVGERSEARRRELAKAAEIGMDFSVIAEDNPGKESGFHICSEIYSAFLDKTKARIVVDREEAIRYAFSLCKKGDVLLLLGKGHERMQRVNGACIPFSEKNIILSL